MSLNIPGSAGMGETMKGDTPDTTMGRIQRPRPNDLTKEYPRSSKDLLGSYVHLARMIDKARAREAGTNGPYIYPCPLDKALLSFLEVTEQDFAYAARTRTDELILEWLAIYARPRSKKQIENWNTQMLARGPEDDAQWTYFKKTRDAIDQSRTDIVTWIDLLDAEEGRNVPLRDTTPTR